ncbi:hypothetical protein ABIA39_001594 [Nocardia sp. GAS34]|uniref:hypothetical protein n=1 Tax=unclassified Nocardia TaxID=2637762 RepID=UPI003D1B1A94
MAHGFSTWTLAVLATCALAAVSGCSASPAGPSRSTTTAPHAATLPADAVHDDNIRFPSDRAPVFAPGSECTAFTPGVRAIADIAPDLPATPMETGHGCWITGDDVVAILTTATSFANFWRRSYPEDDGSGLTAMTVDKDSAQLFERFILDQRYYAVRAGDQWAAGLDSGVTKTVCMLTVDTGSTRPLQVTVTQQVARTATTVKTVRQQCDLASAVAHTALAEHDPGGGSRISESVAGHPR